MSQNAPQVFDFNYFRSRLDMERGLSGVDIFYGLIDPLSRSALLCQTWKADDKKKIDAATIDFFRANHVGDFTARLKPSGQFIWFSNGSAEQVPGSYKRLDKTMQGTQTEAETINNLEAKIRAQIAAEQRIKELEQQIEDHKEDLKQYQTGADRLYVVLERLAFELGPKLFPSIGQALRSAPGAPLQGTQHTNEQNTAPNMPENLDELETALSVIIANFGEDWVIRFSQRIANDPGVVQQIKNFFP